MRFHSAPVIRLADAKPMSLGHVIKSDARWRLFAFADTKADQFAQSRLAKLCSFLSDPQSTLFNRYKSNEPYQDHAFDLRVILQDGFRDVNISDLPQLLWPKKGKLGLVDYEKVFCPDLKFGQNIFDLRVVSKDQGALIIVRPDQYIANILALDDCEGLINYFDQFLIKIS